MKRDYADSGLTIREAMIADAKDAPRRSVADNYIVWSGREVRTSFLLSSPWEDGFIDVSVVRRKNSITQGFDIKVEEGELISSEGEHFSTLRTWILDKYEDVISYRFHAPKKSIWIWNVYKMLRGNNTVEEKWTENAGFWMENIKGGGVLLHCSHGAAAPPDFESLVFQLVLRPLPG